MEQPNGDKPEFPSIGGDYNLIEKLGEGAFGEVYKAHHELLDQEFAVKLLRPELSEDQDVRDRFLDEARALIRFSHPNVVQVRHVGEHKGRLFLVMDLVHGVELTELMRTEGAFDEKRAVAICRQILAGLEAAHAAGIVHRDLKPSNMLVDKRADGSEHVSILDFGLSKFSAIDGVKGAHRSITGTIVGTLAYMSPEQIKGEKDIDGRSDMFAAGLILQEMLEGHHPYPGDSGIVVAAKLLRDPIPPIEEKRASQISAMTKGALARALERDRDARFASVTAFAQALEGKGPPSDTSRVTTIEDTARELARQEAAARKKARAEASGTAEAGQPKKKSLVPLLLVLLLLGGGGAAFALFGNKGGEGEGGSGATNVADGGKGAGNGGTGTAGTGGVTPAPEQPAPAPEQPTPAPEQPAPAPEQPTPAPEQPTPAPEQPTPAPEQPTPAPEQPVPPAVPDDGALSPKDCCGKASPLFAAGNWAEARRFFKKATDNSELTDDLQVAALRGVAESYIANADQLARSGKVKEALALLGETVSWLSGRYAAYEKVPQAASAARLQLGFARLHMGEALVETARWSAVSGDKQAAAAALAQAADHYEFALHQLERDGVRYWEFLIRRAQFHRMKGDTESMIADVAHTTKTSNEEVPAHMWVAHATAARRIAEAWSARGNRASAYEWANKAWQVAEDGASWQEDKLSRQQWLDLARVLFLKGALMPDGEDPTAIHGKIRYWIEMAEKQPAAAWLPEAAAKARVATAHAMERYLQGLVFGKRGQAAEKTKALEAAASRAGEAISLQKQAAAAGGPLPEGLPYAVLAAAYTALGRSGEAQAATQAAAAANARNPD